ncbi:alkaline phosphatase [Aliifodinibius salipaludis]|uniref:Alkaline phosphatase n=1 Tax=Fodinibius salipaludis TaxID=2032627 RepID=A0A2A2GC21_9BACT|nr:alkaline phosphatase [Aliifodinibius salipaludis]PAU94427.1 alkaline phosphatase [Aliifodinibius salipaludis]
MSNSDNSSSRNGISRRQFLKSSALSSLGLGTFMLGGCDTNSQSFQDRGEAKNVIFMVSDGMSAGTFNMGDLIKRRQFGNLSHWVDLYNSDRKFHRGIMDMASLNSPVTGSAAAASSWGCGHRINNQAVNTGPNGEEYKPINQIFKDAGKKTGLVTTTRITHATPAGFSVSIDSRGKEDQIAKKYLQREYDLMLGGGARHFKADSRDDGQDLISKFSDKNYTIARTKQELSEASVDSRLLGLFYDSHLPYTIDHQTIDEHQKNIPNLAEMTDKALQHLENQNGFILQVEGGRVDHGAHTNDAAGMLYDQVAFDDAVKVALDFVDQRDDTLLIITTDHGNANPALNAAGDGYNDSGPFFDRLQDFRHSNNWILSELDENSSVADIRERVEYATQLGIEKEEAQTLRKALNGNLETIYDIKNYPSSVLGSILANYTSVSFTSGGHTSDYVELAALGPGIENLDHFTRNTELFDLMVNAAGVNANMAIA